MFLVVVVVLDLSSQLLNLRIVRKLMINFFALQNLCLP